MTRQNRTVQLRTPWNNSQSSFFCPGSRSRSAKLFLKATRPITVDDFTDLRCIAEGIVGIAAVELSQVDGFFTVVFTERRVAPDDAKAQAQELFRQAENHQHTLACPAPAGEPAYRSAMAVHSWVKPYGS